MIYFVIMGLHIAAWILIHWLLTTAWLDPARANYALWAGVIVLLWWIGWIRRNPPWPARPEQRILIYGTFAATIFMEAVFMGRWQGYFILLLVILLWGWEQFMKRQGAA